MLPERRGAGRGTRQQPPVAWVWWRFPGAWLGLSFGAGCRVRRVRGVPVVRGLVLMLSASIRALINALPEVSTTCRAIPGGPAFSPAAKTLFVELLLGRGKATEDRAGRARCRCLAPPLPCCPRRRRPIPLTDPPCDSTLPRSSIGRPPSPRSPRRPSTSSLAAPQPRRMPSAAPESASPWLASLRPFLRPNSRRVAAAPALQSPCPILNGDLALVDELDRSAQ